LVNARKNSAAICIVVLICCAATFAQGGPPLISDDPGTPGNNQWEIDISYPYEASSVYATMDLPILDINYGLGDHIELSYLGGWLAGKNSQGWRDGWDDSLFGVKWRFLDQDKSGVDMSIYPQLSINTTTSLVRAGLAESGVGFYFPFEIAKTIGKWELDAEWGYQYWQHDKDQWQGGPVIGYILTDRIELLGEARFTFDQSFENYDLILDGGFRLDLVEHVQLLFAAGRSVRNGDDHANLYLYAGLGFTF
jgi:hypothetical protein